MKIYFLPGLGLDKRVFRHLNFDDLPVKYIEWIDPLPDESIADYAFRLFPHRDSTTREIVLVGYSFGGVVAQEIAAQIPVEKIILLSSVKSRREIPWKIRITAHTGLYKLINKKLIANTVGIWGGLYDLDSRDFQRAFTEMVTSRSDRYLQWALRQLAVWQAPDIPAGTEIFQIHGRKDKTFPIGLIHDPDVVIEHGGHFMVFKRATEVQRTILEVLNR